MPLRKAAISAGVRVTVTRAGFDPPLASRSGLTPRDPADATVPVFVLSAPSFEVIPPRPNLLEDAGGFAVDDVVVAAGLAVVVVADPLLPASDEAPAAPATTVTATGLYEIVAL
jgi:hypothetical protein